MRFVVFQGGLGNQIFQYLFLMYLKNTLGCSHVFPLLDKNNLKTHNGWELDKWFDTGNLKLLRCQFLIYNFVRLLRKLKFFPFITEEKFSSSWGIYAGYWQNKKYFNDNVNNLNFSKIELSKKNEELLARISDTNSVSIHIRRGDYLMEKYAPIYCNVCTIDYYNEAIAYIENKLGKPAYYVFSDDMSWVKENFRIRNATYIDWNTGADSFYDMYLMSFCQHHIIANSSFSFWGARLSKNQDGINIYPSKWYNSVYKAPDIFPENWIGLTHN